MIRYITMCDSCKFQFSYLYIYTPLFAQKLWVRFPSMLSTKKLNLQKFCMVPHMRKHAHTYAPEVVYRICRPGFLRCNCKTVKPAKEICINLVKLLHKLYLRSLLIIEKSYFNVLITQLIQFQTQIWVKFHNRFVGTLKPMIPGLWNKSHPVINKNAFPRKWISKVITSDVLHLCDRVLGTWNSWKLLYEILTLNNQ